MLTRRGGGTPACCCGDTTVPGGVLTGTRPKSLEDLGLPLVSFPEVVELAAAAFLNRLAMTSAASEAATAPLGSFSTILLRYSRYTESNPLMPGLTLDEVADGDVVVVEEVDEVSTEANGAIEAAVCCGDCALRSEVTSDFKCSEVMEVVDGIKGGIWPEAAAAATAPGNDPPSEAMANWFMKGELA